MMSDHPKYGHLPRCPKDPNKLCDYNTLKDKANSWDRIKNFTKSRENHKKIEALEHHFEHNECMFRFDFNMLMDENSSELTPYREPCHSCVFYIPDRSKWEGGEQVSILRSSASTTTVEENDV